MPDEMRARAVTSPDIMTDTHAEIDPAIRARPITAFQESERKRILQSWAEKSDVLRMEALERAKFDLTQQQLRQAQHLANHDKRLDNLETLKLRIDQNDANMAAAVAAFDKHAAEAVKRDEEAAKRDDELLKKYRAANKEQARKLGLKGWLAIIAAVGGVASTVIAAWNGRTPPQPAPTQTAAR